MDRTEPARMPELMSRDRAALDALLDSTIVGNIAFVAEDGSPAVLPTAVARWGEYLTVHGSTGSRWMRLVTAGQVAVSITAVDGIIVARSAFESSLAYRSAVLFGSFQTLAGDEKSRALDALTDPPAGDHHPSLGGGHRHGALNRTKPCGRRYEHPRPQIEPRRAVDRAAHWSGG